jgi:hypothetical protein
MYQKVSSIKFYYIKMNKEDVRYSICITEVNQVPSNKSTYSNTSLVEAKKNIITKIKNVVPRKRTWEIDVDLQDVTIKVVTEDLEKACKNLENVFAIDIK